MSVLACDRTDCENVMCSRLILDGKFYICDDCYAELCEHKETWPDEMRPREVYDKIWNFMRNTSPGTYSAGVS